MDEAVVSRLLDPAFDPRREIVLPEGTAGRESPGFQGSSRLVEERADRVVLETKTNAPGFVVLLDGFDPGWRARLDGQPAALLRANLAFRAVAIPEGNHRIELVYRPRGLLLGLLVSVLCLAPAALVAARGEARP